jgi:YfiH family protein
MISLGYLTTYATKKMNDFIVPAWSAPARVRALVTTRQGGFSQPPWNSLNLGTHVGDDDVDVANNRNYLRQYLPVEPVWLNQVHSTRCIDAAHVPSGKVVDADASISRQPGVVCAVLTADCLPVLLCDEEARVVGVAHAGWRGLAAGVIESTVVAMAEPAAKLSAWLGPAIGPQKFEVGHDVFAAFVTHDADAADAFHSQGQGKWLCDIYKLARQRLAALGVRRIASADFCTVRDTEQFFSYRRDGVTGRFASCIWLE